MSQLFDIPVLMLVFNRPDETQRVFDAVKQAQPKKLYIAADGPRAHRADDNHLSEKTRAIIKQIDWPCEVKTLFREQNLGCGPAVSQAITWFFEHEEMGIILEDDCLPSPDFFTFCQVMLKHYEHNPTVMQICGSNFQQGNIRGDASYYFSMFSYIWGWATWRRAWQHYDYTLSTFKHHNDLHLDDYTQHPGIKRYWQHTFLYSKKGMFNTWDYQWGMSILKNKGVCLVSNYNLVTNIGNTDNSTHSSNDDDFWTVNQPLEKLSTIKHTTEVIVNGDADNYFYEKALKPDNSLTQKIVKGIRHIRTKYGF